MDESEPSYGQCAITAMLVHDMLGRTIRIDGGGTHYFNCVNGHYIDFTKGQFDLYDIQIQYEPCEIISREYCGKMGKRGIICLLKRSLKT